MAAEVPRLAARFAQILHCSPCAIGIAIDAVAERYGHQRHDWRCPRRDCAVSKYGPDAKQEQQIGEAIAALAPPAGGPDPSGLAAPDSRLPRENDDSEPLPF